MTRPILERFIAAHDIGNASILLHRYPITLERWRNGQDEIPQAVADWPAEWAEANPATILLSGDESSLDTEGVKTLASIRIPAGSLGPDDLLPSSPVWRLSYSPAELARLEAMANSKGAEVDERTAAEQWEIAVQDCHERP